MPIQRTENSGVKTVAKVAAATVATAAVATGAALYLAKTGKLDQFVGKNKVADQARTIRIPVHMVETINKLKKVTRKLAQELSRKPTEEELAVEMNISVPKLREIIKVAQEPLSLETPIGKEEDSRLGDFIEDKDADAPVKTVAQELLREDLAEVLSGLSPRERDVLRLRFGMDDGRQRTLEEVGQLFGVTRERIRQIEAKALRKLRHPKRINLFSLFFVLFCYEDFKNSF